MTATKSAPRNTRTTPGSANSAVASGLRAAASAEAKSAVDAPITSRPGRNFSVAGLGVPSVSMNMTETLGWWMLAAGPANRTRPVPLTISMNGGAE